MFSRGYPLRPEFVESTYLLYTATRDPFYLAVGREILQSLQKYALFLSQSTCRFCACACACACILELM